ncbi:MAG TPA: hypothetical protein VJ063_18465 [Verrucomicrobiae bacterium]|nr:hypothetical protein [Verrucomicrobiae bacterium]
MGYWVGSWRRIVELVFVCFFGVGVCAPGLYAQTPPLGVSLKWKPNATNPPSGGYHVYYGPLPGIYTGTVTVGPTTTKARLEPLIPGAEYYIVLTAFNLDGVESLPTDPPLYFRASIPPPPTNTAPSISAIVDQALEEDHESRTINFTVSDADSPANTLTVRAHSSNPRLIPDSFILLGGNGNQRSLMIVPQLDQSGRADITLEVRDPQGASNSVTFAVTVAPVNDDPVISAVPNQVVSEDTTVKIPFYIFDAETSVEELWLDVYSFDEDLIPFQNIAIQGTGYSRVLTFTPAKDAYGSCNLLIFVADPEGAFAWTEFTVSVLPVNDRPTLNPIPSFSVDEGSGPVTVTLSGISSGATNEVQPLTVSAVSSAPQIIPTPAVTYSSPSNSASLVIAPPTATSGTALITVSVSDGQAANGITNQTFAVNVRRLNTPPAILSLPQQPLALRIPSLIHVDFTVQDPDTPIESLRITGQSSNRTLLDISDLDFSGTGAQRSLTLKPISPGSVTVTVIVSDGESTVSSSFQVFITLAGT